MAIDAYIMFQDYNGNWLEGESQAKIGTENQNLASPQALTAGTAYEIDAFSFDIEQTLNIGSQSAGAGKVSFNSFSIKRSTSFCPSYSRWPARALRLRWSRFSCARASAQAVGAQT